MGWQNYNQAIAWEAHAHFKYVWCKNVDRNFTVVPTTGVVGKWGLGQSIYCPAGQVMTGTQYNADLANWSNNIPFGYVQVMCGIIQPR